jgi:hypothetical protein
MEYYSQYRHGCWISEKITYELYNTIDNTDEINEVNMVVPSKIMDEQFTMDEIANMTCKTKLAKVSGTNNIPYEVLKNDESVRILTIL